MNLMKKGLNKDWLRHFEYAGYTIYIYPKTQTDKALEFYLLDPKDRLTKETLWIPKSAIENNKDGSEYYGLDWIFDDYKNKEKLEKIGYRL